MTSSVHAGIPRLIGLEWLQKHEDAVVLRWRRACELFQLFPRSHSLPNVPVKPVYKWLFFFSLHVALEITPNSRALCRDKGIPADLAPCLPNVFAGPPGARRENRGRGTHSPTGFIQPQRCVLAGKACDSGTSLPS